MGSGRSRAILPVGLLATVLWSVAVASFAPIAHAQSNPLAFATDGRDRPVLRGGWTLYEPYQFVEGEGTLTGIDTLISQDLAERLGYVAEFQYIDWADHVIGIRDGTVDFASGATRNSRAVGVRLLLRALSFRGGGPDRGAPSRQAISPACPPPILSNGFGPRGCASASWMALPTARMSSPRTWPRIAGPAWSSRPRAAS